MNTRIDRSLKDAGDNVLAVVGFSPSEAVRAFWEYIVAHRDRPDAVSSLLHDPTGKTPTSPSVQAKLDALEAGRRLCASLGRVSPQIAQASYEDLRASAYAQRYGESLQG